MDEVYKFIIEKLKFGFESEYINNSFTNNDIERLFWPADDYKKIPTTEWNEWSRKTHHALQVAFLHDTSNLKDLEGLELWRTKCIGIVKKGFEKEQGKILVIDNTNLHFVKEDLLHHLLSIYGQKRLTEFEKKLISIFSGANKVSSKSGCLLFSVLILLTIIILIFLYII